MPTASPWLLTNELVVCRVYSSATAPLPGVPRKEMPGVDGSISTMWIDSSRGRIAGDGLLNDCVIW
jgi:hypothetical protein